MKLKSLLVLGMVIALMTSCQNAPTPPPGIAATFSTGETFYNCSTGSPIALAFQGIATSTVTAQFTSVSAPQFNETFVYGFQDQDITSISAGGCANIRVPDQGEYTATIRYIEDCNLGNDTCFRWFTMQTLPSGFVPTCNVQQQIFVNQLDPNGFTGPCM